MRIVLDIQGAQNNSRERGIGRYTMALARGIIRNRRNHEVILVINSLFDQTINELREVLSKELPRENTVAFCALGPVAELDNQNDWRLASAKLLREKFLADLKPDVVLLGTLFEGAFDDTVTSIGTLSNSLLTAVVHYDLIPFISPERFLPNQESKGWYYGKIRDLKKANLLLTISDYAATEVVENLALERSQVVSIGSAVEDQLFKVGGEKRLGTKAVLERFAITKPFVMHASAYEPRKNFEGLIGAYAKLPMELRNRYQLVLVCKLLAEEKGNLISCARSHGLANDELILTGFIPDGELVALYRSCKLFVFPSLHEGFGLPALEAMTCGAATIGSNTSSLPEVLGREDATFNPRSEEDISSLICRALTDSDFYASLKAHAVPQSQKFNWDETAKKAIKALEELYEKGAEKKEEDLYEKLISKLALLAVQEKLTERQLEELAASVDKNEKVARNTLSALERAGKMAWRLEGPFDSSYSLALVNRETARALHKLGHSVALHSTEGPGDFEPQEDFLENNSDLAALYARIPEYPHEKVEVVSRNLYPPRVHDMRAQVSILHNYGWEETGFPADWVDDFNAHLDGLTVLSAHVRKVFIDNGVALPMMVSGAGVDHWERVHSETFSINAKSFRFLHVSSCFPRKGIDILLQVYGQYFSSEDDVSLVIKTFPNPHNEIEKHVAKYRVENPLYPDVILIQTDLSDRELKGLYAECDVLVAPSKAEGFGLPLAEAMLSGLPVITTNWGGQLDFCDNENSWLIDYQFERAKSHFGIFSSVWARPDSDALGTAMREAARLSKAQLQHMAESGRKKLLENFKWEDAADKCVNFVKKLYIREDVSRPKIGWITTYNSKCGIAAYSKNLLAEFPEKNVTIFAPLLDKPIKTDPENCHRLWVASKESNALYRIENHFKSEPVDIIIIQFNYGLFNFLELSDFIDRQHACGRLIVVFMHSTTDPFGPKFNWQLCELQAALQKAARVFVHGVADLNRLKTLGLIHNTALFPHGALSFPSRKREQQSTVGVPVVASYGFCLPHKGLVQLIHAAALLRDAGTPVRFHFVNAEYPARESTALLAKMRSFVIKHGLSNLVEIHSEFMKDEESLSLLSQADLLVFPYQGTGESSSAAVRHGLATGKPVAVTPLEIFEDLGDAVFRLPGADSASIATGITQIFTELATSSEKARNVGKNANQWCREHDYQKLSRRLSGICYSMILNDT